MRILDELKKLTQPYADEDYLDEEPVETAGTRPAFRPREQKSYKDYAETPAETAEEKPQSGHGFPHIGSVLGGFGGTREEASASGGEGMRLMVMKPEKFEDAAGIAENMRLRRSIVLNLEDTPRDTARRIVDFISGVAYALGTRVKRISAGTYIISAGDVDLMGADLEGTQPEGTYF